jgi:deoxyribose-phosphate aldolase
MSPSLAISSIELAVSSVLDYTDLRKEITYGDIEALCLEARVYGLQTVVVPSALVAHAVRGLANSASVACPIAYPFGTQTPSVKAREVDAALSAGARELDIVPHFGALRARRWKDVKDELEEVARAARGATLKLILEIGYLENDILQHVCVLARDTGFSFVANTIGFRIVSIQPETVGAASFGAVERLVRCAGPVLGVKAVGGARTLDDVAELRAAGASRVAVAAERGLLASWAGGGSQ